MAQARRPSLRRPGTGDGREEPVNLHDEFNFPSFAFVIPPHYKDDVDHFLLPHGMIVDRIEKLALDIKRQYGDTELHVVCILKGAHVFFSHLMRELNKLHRSRLDSTIPQHPAYLEHFVRLKSYADDHSTGIVQGLDNPMMIEEMRQLKGKQVLIVEDLIDTGHTLIQFSKFLLQFEPASIGICSLLEKRTPRNTTGFRGDFVGFSIPDAFVIGFGLDYNEYFRDLEHIGVISQAGKRKYKIPDASPKKTDEKKTDEKKTDTHEEEQIVDTPDGPMRVVCDGDMCRLEPVNKK